jgi:phage gpG-like protein
VKDFYKQILDDVAVELTDEFDKNFERKAFFTKRWSHVKIANRRGSLLLRTARLRRSIQHRKGSNSIRWTSSLPYAGIHNEGGEITVTAKMKKYFWAMYLKTIGTQNHDVRKRTASNRIRNERIDGEAQQYKSMALKPVGSKITIIERRFIGDHPEVRNAIQRCVDITFNEIEELLRNQLSQR